MQVHLSGRRVRRQLLVFRMVLLACEETRASKISFSLLVERIVQYGAKLTPPIREGEAESMLVLLLEHML